MSLPKMLLDTDTLLKIIKRNPVVTQKAKEYLSEHGQFIFSVITRYEILRGLKAKRAFKQKAIFDNFCRRNIMLPVTDEVVIKGAEIYANLKQKGLLIPDADILIGATAIIHELGIVTDNLGHFNRISGLQVETWQKES